MRLAVTAIAALLALTAAHSAQANLIATPPTIDFGSVLIGTTASQAITLAAEPGFIVASAGGTGINIPFSFNQGTHNADFTVFNSIESFTPLALGLVTGTLTIAECPALGRCIPTDIFLQGIGVDSLPVAVPEPASLALFAGSLGIFAFARRKRRVVPV